MSSEFHTSSRHLTRPKESARKSFTECIFDDLENDGKGSDNRHIKSIIQPLKSTGPIFGNPHKFEMVVPSMVTVGEHGDVVTEEAFRRPTRDRLALHHFVVRSREELVEKMGRGNDELRREEF